jgi:hypothetical protein
VELVIPAPKLRFQGSGNFTRRKSISLDFNNIQKNKNNTTPGKKTQRGTLF